MSRLFVRPPRRPSQSARDVAFLLGARLIRRVNSRYSYRPGDRIINWGNPLPLPAPGIACVNQAEAVARAIDKRETWKNFGFYDVPTVEWTDDHEEALRWLIDDHRVIHRRTLRGSQGAGCQVYSLHGTDHTLDGHHFDEMAFGGVYVKVFGRNPRHVTEYRVSVCDGQVIDYSQKKRRRDYEGRIDPYIRSYGNGWVFCREEVNLPELAAITAQDAVEALGLDFGAVDLGVHRGGDTCVYEVNTAPGIEGTSHRRWADALASCVAVRSAA